MRKVKEILSKNIRVIRQSRGLTQNDFAQLVGCSKNHISAIERGVKFPRAKMIEKCSTALQIKPFILFVDLQDLEWENYISGIIQKSSQVVQD